MKINLIFLVIIQLIIPVFSVVPLWNFGETAIDLLSTNPYKYTIYSGKICTEGDIKLEKSIKKNSDNSITEQNYVTINGNKMQTDWEDIESIFCNSNKRYVCPKGKYHLYKYDGGLYEMRPNDFGSINDWELQCYYQYINYGDSVSNFLFVSYLHKKTSTVYLYYYSFENSNWGKFEFQRGMMDFKWQSTYIDNYEFPMAYIGIDSGWVKVFGAKIYIQKNSNIGRSDAGGARQITSSLTNWESYFSKSDDTFYYITYDKNPPKFKSGYSTVSSIEKLSIESSLPSNGIQVNENSPLYFDFNYEITTMKLIKNTKYAYYEILNTDNNQPLYGMIDITSNKIVFNTNEKINYFNSYTKDNQLSNSMLIITDTSAYRICALSDGSNCIDSCPTGQSIIINSQGKNTCGNSGCTNFILKPNDICINECDLNIYAQNGNQCGYCKDIYSSTPYKLLNTSGCLSEQPSGTYFYNENFKLLKKLDIPTTIPSNIPTTILTTIPTTTPTTTSTTIPTTIPTTISTTIHTTIPTNIPTTIPINKGMLCNITEDLYPVNYGYGNFTSGKQIKCLNKSKKESYDRFYFDEKEKEFRTCYETCKKCKMSGNKTFHNCIICESGFRFRPEGFPKNNCVIACPYYEFTSYEQYKCIENLPCPKNSLLYIKDKKRCIDDCKRDNTYKYQYNGNCYINCPNNLTFDKNLLCKDNNIFEFTLTTNNIDLDYNSFINSVENYVNSYSREFNYTSNHISQYINKEYSAIIYKNRDCINSLKELSNFPKIDFGNCYDKVQGKYNITEDLVVMVINKFDDNNNPITSYSFFDPITGDKLNTDVCKNDTIIMVENILSLINENISNYDAMLALMKQGINIFNKNDDFYHDLCYDYYYKTDKDIALKDRLKLFFPNISLCDPNCSEISVDLEHLTANCECEFNDLSNKKISNIKKAENDIVDNLMGDVFEFIESSNINVGKCFSKGSNFLKDSYGAYIVIFLFAINTVVTVIFYSNELNSIKIYIYQMTQNFLRVLNGPNIINVPPLKNKSKTIRNDDMKINNNNIIKNKRLKKKLKTHEIKNLNIMIAINKNNVNSKTNSKEIFLRSSSFKIKNLNKKNTDKRKSNIIRKISREKTNLGKKNSHIIRNIDKRKTNKSLPQDILNTQNYEDFFNEFFSESPDDMEFDDAIIFDKRKFCQSFSDNLKEKQIISNTFCVKDVFKPRTIKIMIFLLNILLYFVINGLFINDDYISEVYYSEKHEIFNSRAIVRFFYTTFVGIIVEFIVDFFFVNENKLKRIFLRDKDDKFALQEEIVLLVNSIKNRFISFTIFLIAIYGICFYYIICFNSIYPKIQIEWIISSIFIFIIRQVLSIHQCLAETIFRFLSFECESERIFKVSKLIN